MADLTKIQFVHEDASQIISESKAYYETLLNRQVAPADIEMLLINGLAYREMLLRSGINETARQNLVSFSGGAALEYLGELVGVSRLPASGALCTLQFNLVEGHTGVVIPEGLRVQSLDGKVIFQTIDTVTVPIGTFTAQIGAACSDAGAIGNGYAINTISIILDPQAYITSGGNIDISTGGADEETDDELRERIKLAPASFSVAGPIDSYKFFAKSAHPSIVDVAVTSPVPGQVNIYPLLEGGQLPSTEILNAVQAICNADKIRPLTDTVVTAAPTTVDFAIEIEITLLTTAVTEQINNDVTTALNVYKDARLNRMGLDVVVNKIASICMIDGVYNVEVISPATNLEASPEQYTRCTGITVSVTGTHDE